MSGSLTGGAADMLSELDLASRKLFATHALTGILRTLTIV